MRPRNYSKSAVQKAGKLLAHLDIDAGQSEQYQECMNVLSHWRSCHIDVLNEVTKVLAEASKHEDRDAIVVGRLKRAPSIIAKLKRNPSMNLERMQDIAGCRSIVKSPKAVERVRRTLKGKFELRETDYIREPKEDGYRGVHLIGKHASRGSDARYQVEIQIRTRLNHAWATAVEIVDLFTNQSLKAGLGRSDWMRFFKLVGDEFAKIEGTTHSKELDNNVELSRLISSLNVYKQFDAFHASLRYIDGMADNKSAYCLIEIDTNLSNGMVRLFGKDAFELASDMYLASEKAAASRTHLVVALVNVASVGSLKEAYPNYFADSTLFLDSLRAVHSSKSSRFAERLYSWLAKTGLNSR